MVLLSFYLSKFKLRNFRNRKIRFEGYRTLKYLVFSIKRKFVLDSLNVRISRIECSIRIFVLYFPSLIFLIKISISTFYYSLIVTFNNVTITTQQRHVFCYLCRSVTLIKNISVIFDGVDTKRPRTKCPITKHPKTKHPRLQNVPSYKVSKLTKCPKLQNIQIFITLGIL